MKYDDTGPVTVNEKVSLLVMVALVVVVGMGVAGAVYLSQMKGKEPAVPVVGGEVAKTEEVLRVNPEKVLPKEVAVAPPRRASSEEGVTRLRSGTVIVRQKEASARLTRSSGGVGRVSIRDSRNSREVLEFNEAVQKLVRGEEVGGQLLSLTAEQIGRIRVLDMEHNILTSGEHKKLLELYDERESAKGAALEAVDAQLMVIVAGATTPTRVELLKEKVGKLGEILTRGQEKALREALAGRGATTPGPVPETRPVGSP